MNKKLSKLKEAIPRTMDWESCVELIIFNILTRKNWNYG